MIKSEQYVPQVQIMYPPIFGIICRDLEEEITMPTCITTPISLYMQTAMFFPLSMYFSFILVLVVWNHVALHAFFVFSAGK